MAIDLVKKIGVGDRVRIVGIPMQSFLMGEIVEVVRVECTEYYVTPIPECRATINKARIWSLPFANAESVSISTIS